MTKWLIGSKSLQNRLSGTVKNTTIDTISFQMNFNNACKIKGLSVFVGSWY